MAFATTLHGTVSSPHSVRITNNGTANVHIYSISLTGTNPTSFIQINTCTPVLAPAAGCNVYVAFKPAAAGSFAATLSLSDNGASSPQTVTLTGTGN
jgi:hypothetical protein